MKKTLCLIISFAMLLTLAACGTGESETEPESAETVQLTVAAVDTAITLDGTEAEVSGSGAQFSDGVVTISSSGTYHISGTGDNIKIKVEAGESANVVLSLEGTDITNTDDEAILTKDTGSVTIVMAEGTENSVSSIPSETEETDDSTSADSSDDSSTTDDENEDASGSAIKAKCPLTISGEGTLVINGSINNGIKSEGDITIESGNLTVNAENDAIKSDTNITVSGGTVTIVSGGDGISAEGDVNITGGTFSISTGDGTDASTAAGFDPQNITTEQLEQMGIDTADMPDGSSAPAMPSDDSFDPSGMETPPAMPSDDSFDPSTMGTAPAMPSDGSFDPSSMGTPPEMPSDGSFDPSDMDTPPEMPDGSQNETAAQPDADAAVAEDSASNDAAAADSTDTASDSSSSSGFHSHGDMGNFWADTASDSLTVSCKGIKAGTSLTITGGTFVINSTDHAIHSTGTISITGGDFTIASSAGKGISGHGDVTIDDGTIAITDATEGIESKASMIINGGNITIDCSDDGLNAGGGSSMFGQGFGSSSTDTDSSSDEEHSIIINGGNLSITARGDGIDSNGDLTVNGGNVEVVCTSGGADSAVDYASENGGTALVTGGTLTATGPSSMAEEFSSDSSQFSLLWEDTFTKGTELQILSSDGTVLYTYTMQEDASCVNISCAGISEGDTITLVNGEDSCEVTVSSIALFVQNGEVTENVSTGFGGFGGGMGNHGGAKNNTASSNT